MKTLLVTLLTVGTLLGIAAPALADGAQVGADIQVAQTLADRELTVIIRRVAEVPGPVQIDLVTHAGTRPGEVKVTASASGSPDSTTNVLLGEQPGFYSGTVHVDRPGPWELAIDEAKIPFVVPANVSSPWENAAYGGFVAAGILLAVALVLALFGRIGLAMVPAGGIVAALAVAVTAAVLAPSIPPPAAPGTQLDPTFDNVNDPYRRTSIVDLSRPPANLVPSLVRNELTLRLSDSASGRPVDDLLVHDNALLHLIMVSPSGVLNHLHPVRTAPGEYRATIRPEPGVYAIAAEIARRGGGVQLLRATFSSASGQATPNDGKADLATRIQPAGTPSTITAGFGTKDLQPWLGMLGHLIVVGPITETPATAPIWAHVHAMIPQSPGMPEKPDESVAAFGPDVSFTYSFPLPGRYLVWVQVERNYSVVTVPTVVTVPAAKGPSG